MSTVPVEITVKRYVCPFCHRGRSKRKPMVKHVDACWTNPENRTCKSCANYEISPDYGPCFPGQPCDCGDPIQECNAGVELPGVGEREGFPVVNCPLWEAKP